MLAGVTVLCAGVTLGIIAGLGQTTSTAAASAIAGAAGIKVGTASFYLYLSLIHISEPTRQR